VKTSVLAALQPLPVSRQPLSHQQSLPRSTSRRNCARPACGYPQGLSIEIYPRISYSCALKKETADPLDGGASAQGSYPLQGALRDWAGSVPAGCCHPDPSSPTP